MMPLTRFGDVMIDLEAVTYARFREDQGGRLDLVIDRVHRYVTAAEADVLSIWAALCELTAVPERHRDEDEAAVLRGLRENPNGMTRTQINRKCFSGHRSSDEMDRLLARLVDAGRLELARDNPGEGFTGKGALWVLKEESR